jgi:hypothetical protein
MSPQEQERRSQEELSQLVDREARSLLGVSWQEGHALLDKGALAGTAAEAQMRMLAFLLDS